MKAGCYNLTVTFLVVIGLILLDEGPGLLMPLETRDNILGDLTIFECMGGFPIELLDRFRHYFRLFNLDVVIFELMF